jgi:hypothetical protein
MRISVEFTEYIRYCTDCYVLGMYRKATHMVIAEFGSKQAHLFVCDEHAKIWRDSYGNSSV